MEIFKDDLLFNRKQPDIMAGSQYFISELSDYVYGQSQGGNNDISPKNYRFGISFCVSKHQLS